MKAERAPSYMQNPHLEGEPFFWEGGPLGVLLIHGFTATTAEVRPLARALNQRGYTLSGPVLPGHNTVPDDINRYRWLDWVRAVETAYRQISARCDHVFVGGESTGGVLALHLASEHPEIAGILAYAPALRLNMRTWDVIKLYLAAPFVPYLPARAKGPREDRDADRLWKGYRVKPLRGIIELLRLQRKVRPRLSRIHQPILIVQGRLDATVDPRVPEMIYSRVSSTIKEIHWFERSGHCVIIDEERAEAANLTVQFIQRVVKGLS